MAISNAWIFPPDALRKDSGEPPASRPLLPAWIHSAVKLPPLGFRGEIGPQRLAFGRQVFDGAVPDAAERDGAVGMDPAHGLRPRPLATGKDEKP